MSDGGHAAVELAMAVAVLLLPVALVVTGFGPWSERRVMAEAVAAEAAREVVLSLDHAAGVDVVSFATDARGLDDSEVRLGWCGTPVTVLAVAAAGCSLQRGTSVEAEVHLWTPLISTPWGPIGGLWVVGHHSEPIDLYRSLG